MSPKIHLLIALSKPQMGITRRAACQKAFSFHAGRQLRGTLNSSEVTCDK